MCIRDRLLLERFSRLEARVAKLKPADTAPAPAPAPAPTFGDTVNRLLGISPINTVLVSLSSSKPTQDMAAFVQRAEGYSGTVTVTVAGLPAGVTVGNWVNQTFTVSPPSADALERERESLKRYCQITGYPYDPAAAKVPDFSPEHKAQFTFSRGQDAAPSMSDIYLVVTDTQGNTGFLILTLSVT